MSHAAGPPLDVPEGNIAELFLGALDVHRKPDALKEKRAGAWHSISHDRVERVVSRLSRALGELGLGRGDRVAILSENRPEWLYSDFACVMSGVVSVPLYPALPADQIDYMLQDSQARAVFVSTDEQLAKIRELRGDLPGLEHVILYDPPDGRAEDVVSFARLLGDDAESGDGFDEAQRSRALATDPHELLTILYTSGTTGRPKGVMLTHNNLVSNVRAALQVLDVGPDDVALSYLPLSHIFERMAGQYALFRAGVTVCYAESIRAVRENLREVRPTVMTSVPRGFEKIYERLAEIADEGGLLRSKLVEWAARVGQERAARVLGGEQPGVWLGLQHRVADRLVFSKIRELTGGRVRFFISGGAPLSAEIARLFHSAGLIILEGYGLTETSPVISTNTMKSYRLGSVGRPIPGVEVAIADDGEILTRGPHVMRGYYRMPETTAEAIDSEGWFRTGDIGRLDRDGFLYVTDRKKELIKTSGGKFVAPQPIENRVETDRYVSQAVLVGDQRKFPALLIVPNFEALERWARDVDVDLGSREELSRNPRVVEFMEARILQSLEDLARFERPKKIALIPNEFSVEGGELTPTLKVKRRVIDEKYAGIIDGLYESD